MKIELVCIGCGRAPNEISEYRLAASDEIPPITPEEYVAEFEGTYNITNGHFACTKCYMEMGAPSGQRRWVAP